MHDDSKVLMGVVLSSSKEISDHAGDPATFAAGLCARLDSNSDLSLAKADGMLLGVSLGKSLSDSAKVAICRAGLGVPVQLTEKHASLVVGDLTFTAVEPGGNDITITLGDTVTAGSEAATVDGDDITIAIEGGVSTATQIKTALEASAEASALVGVVIKSGEESTAQAAASQDALEGGVSPADYAVVGSKAYIDDVTGKMNDSGESAVTVSDAVFVSGPLTGVAEDGSEVSAALVDFQGGL